VGSEEISPVDYSDSPMDLGAAAALSAQILSEQGIGVDQAKGTTANPANARGATPRNDNDDGAGAPATPRGSPSGEPSNAGGGAPGAWVSKLPASVQANLSGYDPETQSQLRALAESGLRLDDYTRKTQALKRSESEIKQLRQRGELLDQLVTRIASGRGADPVEPDDAPPSMAALMDESDPEAFASGLEKFISHAIEKKTEAVRQASPETRGALVNDAADQIRGALGDKITDEQWNRACDLYVENCAAFGTAWQDSDPQTLPAALRPHIRQALIESQMNIQGAASQDGVDDFGNPTGSSPTGAKSTPAQGSGTRAASLSQGMGAGTPTRVPPPADEAGMDPEDLAYRRTMARFNIPNDEALAKLRQVGA